MKQEDGEQPAAVAKKKRSKVNATDHDNDDAPPPRKNMKSNPTSDFPDAGVASTGVPHNVWDSRHRDERRINDNFKDLKLARVPSSIFTILPQVFEIPVGDATIVWTGRNTPVKVLARAVFDRLFDPNTHPERATRLPSYKSMPGQYNRVDPTKECNDLGQIGSSRRRRPTTPTVKRQTCGKTTAIGL